jgi:hypothetical protein
MVKKITNNGDVVYIYDSDPETVDAYHKDFQNYQKKLGRFVPLPLLMHIHDLDWNRSFPIGFLPLVHAFCNVYSSSTGATHAQAV